MSKIALFAVAVCSFVVFAQARECYYIISGELCPYECCGEIGSMKCLESCNGEVCGTDEDCGDNGCCSNGKCADESACQTTYISCNYDCPEGCCDTRNGTCTIRSFGCLPLNSICSSNDACVSECCHNDLCRSDFVCDEETPTESGPDEEEHDSSEHSRSHTKLNWKTPVIVVVIIVAVVVKFTILGLWIARRSRSRARVVVIRGVRVQNSTVQVAGHACDTIPIMSQDEEQMKHEQAPPPYTATA